MKKKLICLLLSVMMLVPSAFAVDLFVDGRQLQPDTEPQIIDGRTQVPVRCILEALGATVNWNGETRTVTATKGDTTIVLTIDSTTAYVNGEAKTLDVPAMIINSRTMVPARFVSESLQANVAWEGETQTVYIATQPAYDGYTIAPEIIYSTTAEENGLGDVYMFVDGTVTGTKNVVTHKALLLETDKGTMALMNPLELPGFSSLQVGSTIRACFQYAGFSEVLGLATGFYMEIGDLNASIIYPGQTTPSTPPADPPVVTPDPEPQPQPEPQQNVVYITPTGKRYHNLASCAGKNAIETTLSNAQSRGLTPCKTCVL